MAHSTRDQFLATARTLFAERGFYGVSIAQIADELGLTKQALLHHFASKEKLYGEVLKAISEEFAELRAAAHASHPDPVERIRRVLRSMIAVTPSERERARLLMRELLDNAPRADAAAVWYLKPLLEELVAMVKAAPAWGRASDAEALALIYQLIGAVSYHGVSAPTLRAILGEPNHEAFDRRYAPQLDALVGAALASGPPPADEA